MGPYLANTERQRESEVLLRLCREFDIEIEKTRLEQIYHEVKVAWPGKPDEQWSKWIVEFCNSVSLIASEVLMTNEEALSFFRGNMKLVHFDQETQQTELIVDSKGNNFFIATGSSDSVLVKHRDQLSTDSPRDTSQRWVMIQQPELAYIHTPQSQKEKPSKRLLSLLQPEWPDIWMILVFAFFAGVLNLATPIAVEALVNTVAFGQLLQPLIVLAIMLFTFLGFAAIMKGLQTYVAEIIQRRLFARVSADLAYRLPRVESSSWKKNYGPELVNRFFDIVTLQKVVANLLLDGVSIVLATFVGMVVLAFYHPWLLGFDLFLILVVGFGLYSLGRGAISSGIDESKMKYRVAAWFEDIVRCQNSFKGAGGIDLAFDRANQLTAQYISTRSQHFRVLFRQISFVLGLQAVAGTVLLGVGGWLVIREQLSLGQLVAAELIVTTILSSLAKLGKHLEGYYDLVAAVDKLDYLFDLPIEQQQGQIENFESIKALDVNFLSLCAFPACKAVDLSIEPGEKIALYGSAGSGKTSICRLLYGLDEPYSGRVEISGYNPRELRPDVLRSCGTLISEIEIFEGTLIDNIRIGRPLLTERHIRKILTEVGLEYLTVRLPDGLQTRLLPSGVPLSKTEQIQLMIARAIACQPSLLVIDGLVDSLPDESYEQVIKALLSEDRPGTLILATGRKTIANRFKKQIAIDTNTPSIQSKETV